jgi:membrane protease YdiL (CAAX protease family)
MGLDRILLAALVALAHGPLVGAGATLILACHAALLGIAAIARRAPLVHVLTLATLAAAMAVGPLRETIGVLPVVPLLVPLLLSTAVSHAMPGARLPHWFASGRIDRTSWALTVIVALLSAAALMVWARWTDNLGIGERMMRDAAQLPRPVLVMVGLPLFALLNAATEEGVYRGVLQTSLARAFARPSVVVILQALAFAAAHYLAGFPNGAAGYLMAAAYGVALGYLRLRTGGLAAPFVAHVIADLVIAYTLLAFGAR